MDFEPDRELMAGAAFRLSWPGEVPVPAVSAPPKKQLLAAKLKAATSKLPFKRRQMPARLRRVPGPLPGPLAALSTLGRKLKTRGLPCLGWPVSLSVPGPEEIDLMPRVKITGKPLD